MAWARDRIFDLRRLLLILPVLLLVNLLRGELYVCGERSIARLRCDALQPGASNSQWTVEFDVAPMGGAFREQSMIAGGALAGDRLIVVSVTGKVIALGAP